MRVFPFVFLFWFEKFVIFIDSLQLLSIILNAWLPWNRPILWASSSNWVGFANFDVFQLTSLTATEAQKSIAKGSYWGEYNGYLYYSLGFSSVALIIYGGVFYLDYLKNYSFGEKNLEKRYKLNIFLIGLCYFFYLPLFITLSRLWYCDSNGYLSVEPDLSCSNSRYLAITIISCVISIPYLVFFPYYLFQIIEQNVVYSLSCDHEKSLQISELMYAFEINNEWISTHDWILSSFNLGGAYYYLSMIVYKVLMVVYFIGLRSNYKFQSAVMWLTTLAFLIYYLIYHPFRCNSSNFLLWIFQTLLLINISFATANAFQIKSGLMVSSVESVFLLALHFFGIALIILVLFFCVVGTSHNFPVIHTINYIISDEELMNRVSKWINCLNHGNKVMIEFTLAHEVIADIDALEEAIRVLRKNWIVAMKHNSIFATPISDLLEDLLILHNSKKEKCSRNNDEWNKVYHESVKLQIFSNRNKRYFFLSKLKRKILIVCLAIRAFKDVPMKLLNEADKLFHQMAAKFLALENNSSRSLTTKENWNDKLVVNQDALMQHIKEAIQGLEYLTEAKLEQYYEFYQTTKIKTLSGGMNAEEASAVLKNFLHGEEFRKLQNMYLLWDTIIGLYEGEELPGHNEIYNDVQVEDWYTFIAALGKYVNFMDENEVMT